jgi:hypothetical protein
MRKTSLFCMVFMSVPTGLPVARPEAGRHVPSGPFERAALSTHWIRERTTPAAGRPVLRSVVPDPQR